MLQNDVKSLVRRLVVLKYVVFVAALGIALLVILRDEVPPFSLIEFAKGMFYSVVSVLLISVFYDIFTRKEVRIYHREELEQQRSLHEEQLASDRAELSERLAGLIDLDGLSETGATLLANRVVENDRLMKSIAGALIGSHGQAFHHTFIRPLVERRALYSVTVVNRLLADPSRDDVYWMAFHQQFHIPAAKTEFCVIFSCDNDAFNNFVTSDVSIDGLIGTSEAEWNDIDQQIASLRLTASSLSSGRRDQREVKHTVLSDKELAQRLRLERLNDAAKIRAFTFQIGSELKNYTFDFSYRVRNSLEDPYYLWFAENPMFVDKVTIDYQHLRQHARIGKVSANCILGNHTLEPQHDADLGVYSVEVGGLVWPGQGAFIVWRSKNSLEGEAT